MRQGFVAMQVQNWFASEQGLPSDFMEVATKLLPRVRERSFVSRTQLYFELEGHEPPVYRAKPVCDTLVVSVVYDLPTTMRELGDEVYEKWGITFDYALDQAVRNLDQISRGDFEQVCAGLFCAPWDDSYQSSRLLLVDRIRSLRLKGKPVASVPSRNHLLICGSDDAHGIAELASRTDATYDEDPRAMSAVPVILHDDRWLPFLPDEGHPAFQHVKTLWVKSEMKDYDDQKKLLDRLHERNAVHVYVAKYSGMRHPTRGVLSFCALTNGVDTLLPHTDQVALICNPDDREEPLMVSWADFAAVAGALLEPADLYPVRYRVRSFPSEEQLVKLRARSVW